VIEAVDDSQANNLDRIDHSKFDSRVVNKQRAGDVIDELLIDVWDQMIVSYIFVF